MKSVANMNFTKAVKKSEVPKKFLAAPKMVSFSQLPAVKKGHHFGAARNIFGPSNFVPALTLDYKKLLIDQVMEFVHSIST